MKKTINGSDFSRLMISAAAAILMLAIVLFCAVTLMPRVMNTFEQVDTVFAQVEEVLGQIDDVYQQLDTVMGDLETITSELSDSLPGLLTEMDSLMTTSGEGITDMDEGRPVFARGAVCKFTLANFMRTHLLSALATLKIGLDLLTGEEKVEIEKLYGHGGYFKTPGVGQRMLSAAVGSPVSVMETAGEGGPYGMALLAAYRVWKKEGQSLEAYLAEEVFAQANSTTLMAEPAEIEGFAAFLERYKKGLPIEQAAIENL